MEKVQFNWDKNVCMTHPNRSMEHIGRYMFTIHNLSGRCSCGKLYSQHEHFVRANEETIAEYHAKYEADKANEKFVAPIVESNSSPFSTILFLTIVAGIIIFTIKVIKELI